MDQFVRPAVEKMFERGRVGIISIGAAIALWSASRLMRVLIEAMNIAYDVEEWRPAWRRRILAVGLTAGAILFFAVFLPFLVVGPRLGPALDQRFGLGGDPRVDLEGPVLAGCRRPRRSAADHAVSRRTELAHGNS